MVGGLHFPSADHDLPIIQDLAPRCQMLGVICVWYISNLKQPVLQPSEFTAPTRQHDLHQTDHEISASRSRAFVYAILYVRRV